MSQFTGIFGASAFKERIRVLEYEVPRYSGIFGGEKDHGEKGSRHLPHLTPKMADFKHSQLT